MQSRVEATRWVRSGTDRAIAGVAGALSRGCGGSVTGWRVRFVGAALLGACLTFGFAIFDYALFGQSLAPSLRVPGIALGLLLCLAYPLLALALPEERKPRKWDFASAFAAVGILVLVGQALGLLFEPYWAVCKQAFAERGGGAFLSWPADYAREVGFGAKDVLLGLFFVCAAGFLWVQREGVRRFFRSMYVGVSLVVLSTLSIGIGVLIPQIDGFEDPDRTVDLAREYADYQLFRETGWQGLPEQNLDGHEQYQAFRWAEGYFLYHLGHLYGIGMPEAHLPPAALEGLERYGTKYGREERDNKKKQMAATFSGQAKIDEIGAFIHRNEETFWRFFQVATALDLNRTYKSHWFAALLWLLATAIAFNTFFGDWRRWFTVEKIGYFFVHVGMLVLLAGGFTSKLLTKRGILELDLRKPPSDTYYLNYDERQPAKLPFHVRLDRFGRRDWLGLEVYFNDEQFSSRPPRYTLWDDRTLALDHVDDGAGGERPRLEIRVAKTHERVEVGLPHVKEAAAGQAGSIPVAEIVIAAEDQTQRLILPSHTQSFPVTRPFTDPAQAFRLAAFRSATPEELFPSEEGVLGTLEVIVSGSGEFRPIEHPVRLGSNIDVPGGYTLRCVSATADFDSKRDRDGPRHPKPLAEQPHTFAALWIEVVPPEGDEIETRTLLEGIDPVEFGFQEQYQNEQVIARFHFDEWKAPGPPRYVLAWDESGAELVGEDGAASAADLETRLPLPGPTSIQVRQLVDSAVFEQNFAYPEPILRADGWDPEFYAREPRGVELEVVQDRGTPSEQTERVVLATTEASMANVWFSGDERFYLVFLENSEMLPFEWRSVLSILEEDPSGALQDVPLGPEQAREIRVNDYFTYAGYRFFQTNANPERPTYSGIGVVYDPGIEIVLFGMYTIITGTVLAFLVRPVVRARRAKEKAA